MNSGKTPDNSNDNHPDDGNKTHTDNLDSLSQNYTRIIERSQEVMEEFLAHMSPDSEEDGSILMQQLDATEAFAEMMGMMAIHPEKMIEAGLSYYNESLKLLSDTNKKFMGENIYSPSAQPNDKRFRDELWEKNFLFDFIRQSYFVTSNWLKQTVEDALAINHKMDSRVKRKVGFYIDQLVDAMSPTNFALTNPEVIRETIISNGENLVRGLENLLEDLRESSKGQLNIRMTDPNAFEIGRDIAATKGKVIYQNELMQLIQYEPATEAVFKTPLLLVPAWINKYYILDMRPENSFVKWLVGQGHTVFIISWVNPDRKLAQMSFEDYMFRGPLDAIDVIRKVTGEDAVNVMAYCLGGTLLSATLAYLAAKGEADKVKSATYLTTLVDFSEPGDISVFTDDFQLDLMEEQLGKKGYFAGEDMRMVFSMLRSRDLIWSFVVNNYLLGRSPFPFDLLYWNSDTTRLPARMHIYYLRNMYRDNLLVRPDELEIGGEPIDLGMIETPSYILSTIEDHIAPWKSTYAATGIYSGDVRFVLSGSGHVAGVINPPVKNKYNYWVNGRKSFPKSPDEWLSAAKEHKGSWWVDWQKWIEKKGYAGDMVTPRQVGKISPKTAPGAKLKIIEDAPGSYVKKR